MQTDVLVGWIFALLVQWLLYEPAVLIGYAFVTLLLKWCTSFDDLPEVKAETKAQQRLQTPPAQLQAPPIKRNALVTKAQTPPPKGASR